MVGKTISHFKILKKIGAGGMGEVFLAEDTDLKRRVVLKFLPPNYTFNSEINARFKREAKAAAALNHPNIITIHEVSEFEGATYIAMEYVEGVTLKEKIKDDSLSLNQIVDYTIQICDGLSKAHQAGIVHRDLKPENIMIDQDNRVRILDFGLAKLKGATQLTKEASTMGTLYYMSPEQFQGEEVDHRADIWATGVLLYEMISGNVPFPGEYEAAVMYSVVNEEPEAITIHRSEVPDKLEQIVKNALIKKCDERYQQIDELLADLQSDKEKMPAVLLSSSVSKKPAKISWARISAATFSILALLAITLFYFLNKDSPIPEKKRVVVAVFKNQTGDSSLDPLGTIAADWISQGLAQTNLMHVVPTIAVLASTHGLEDSEQSVQMASVIPFLASKTKSDIVISGNYYKQGETIQFQAQVMELATNKLLGGLEPVGGSLEDAISTIGELKQKVMGVMATHLDARMEAFTHGISQPPNYQAYNAFIEGLAYQTRHNFRKAKDLFYQAYSLDTTFVTALINASGCHLNLGQFSQVDSISNVLYRYRERLTPV